MKSILNYLNLILNFLPFNGYKLVLGAVLGIVAKLIVKEVPTADDIRALLEALSTIGFSLAGLGLGHKVVKIGVKAMD